jgi:hypothetical protein
MSASDTRMSQLVSWQMLYPISETPLGCILICIPLHSSKGPRQNRCRRYIASRTYRERHSGVYRWFRCLCWVETCASFACRPQILLCTHLHVLKCTWLRIHRHGFHVAAVECSPYTVRAYLDKRQARTCTRSIGQNIQKAQRAATHVFRARAHSQLSMIQDHKQIRVIFSVFMPSSQMTRPI